MYLISSKGKEPGYALQKESLEKVRDKLVEQFQKSAKALAMLSFEGIQAIETVDGNVIVGTIVNMKYEDSEILIQVIAAKDVDYKLRNLERKGIKKRTYPLPLYAIVSAKTLEVSQVPLYINYGFKSTQFKNQFFNARPESKLV